MYKRIVKARIRAVFDQISRGEVMPMVDSLAPRFVYVFHGDHALGGRRTTREAMIRWWERVGSILPGARFAVDDVIVDGGPWHTRIAVRTRVSGALPGGGRYENTMFQFLTLRWGRITAVETLEDLQVLQRALAEVAAAGNPDAAAAPISDSP
ncbi:MULTISPECIES: nuclear transport factor 2 family protein [unclassified Brevibacterium]|uniref:nuclear transport factor 2 family protein n=1 Tax=unclassified Brevibacterium TaxID=2614124 RepID=UPI0010F76644|nr:MULTISPECIES: nuclear transport factor 2 family protein [unclassified Brevibacterium]MCM1012009.1 nuclear transport factor 2 family protein [Brevibacterium sp. XM4083]